MPPTKKRGGTKGKSSAAAAGSPASPAKPASAEKSEPKVAPKPVLRRRIRPTPAEDRSESPPDDAFGGLSLASLAANGLPHPLLLFALQAQRARAQMQAEPEPQLPFPTAPNTKIESESGADVAHGIAYGMAAMQGWRPSMEDAHICIPDCKLEAPGAPPVSIFGVFDGHVGVQVANFLAERIRATFPATLSFLHLKGQLSPLDEGAVRAAFVTACETLDERIGADPRLGSYGSTAVVSVVLPEHVITVSVGDSRSVLMRRATAEPLTYDHKPNLPEEQDRIVAGGGLVFANRVNGSLAMSRAFGDFVYKRNTDGPLGTGGNPLPANRQPVVATPSVTIVPRKEDDVGLIVACDGVWDVLHTDAAAAVVRSALGRRTEEDVPTVARDAAALLCETCCAAPGLVGPARGAGSDNLTAVVVLFAPSRTAASSAATLPPIDKTEQMSPLLLFKACVATRLSNESRDSAGVIAVPSADGEPAILHAAALNFASEVVDASERSPGAFVGTPRFFLSVGGLGSRLTILALPPLGTATPLEVGAGFVEVSVDDVAPRLREVVTTAAEKVRGAAEDAKISVQYLRYWSGAEAAVITGDDSAVLRMNTQCRFAALANARRGAGEASYNTADLMDESSDDDIGPGGFRPSLLPGHLQGLLDN